MAERESIRVYSLSTPHCDKARESKDYLGNRVYKCIHLPKGVDYDELPVHVKVLYEQEL